MNLKSNKFLFSAFLLLSFDISYANQGVDQYKDVLDYYYKIVSLSDDNMDIDLGVGVQEAANGLGKEKALKQIGYLIKDITGDNIPELLIGTIGKNFEEFSSCKGNEIYEIYTLVNNKPQIVVEGWGRNSICTISENLFVNSGSGGAANSLVGKFSLTSNGQEKSWSDFYYSYPDENDFEIVNFYKNKNSDEMDPSTSTKININFDQFEKIGEAWYKQTAPINGFISFEKYNSNSSTTNNSESLISVKEAPKDLTTLGSFEYVNLANTTPVLNLLFNTTTNISDFRILNLKFVDVDENGKVKYEITPIKTYEQLSSNKNIVVSINMIGSIPNNGISFKSLGGKEYRYSVSQSGQDGSIILTEF